MSGIISNIANGLKYTQCPCKEALVTGAVSWLAYSVTQVGFLDGTALGYIAVAASRAAYLCFESIGLKNKYINLALSGAAGGCMTYGISLAAATVGFVASPITIPTTVILTTIALASLALNVDCNLWHIEYGETSCYLQFKLLYSSPRDRR